MHIVPSIPQPPLPDAGEDAPPRPPGASEAPAPGQAGDPPQHDAQTPGQLS